MSIVYKLDDINYGDGGYIFYPDYDEKTSKKYPVLYLFHGTGWNEVTCWRTDINIRTLVENLIKEKKFSEMIIVMPHIKIDRNAGKSLADPFYNFKFKELVNFINKKYEKIVAPNIDNTAVGGFSMGGAAALRYAIENKDIIGHVGAASPGPVINEWYTDNKLTLVDSEKSVRFMGRGSTEDACFLKTVKRSMDAFKNNGFLFNHGNSAYIVKNCGHDSRTFNRLLSMYIQELSTSKFTSVDGDNHGH